jgi:hypothetical protein
MYGVTKWFNEGTIKAQLHVDMGKTFEACSDEVAEHYTMF